ncbi:MAG: cobalt ECF transporter T component CbiQ [Methanosarcinaceae archaeon]|jgi:cobalt/nickel transport system permease protein|nr:cobalt ECF transporter T component CbiQ [Methanosarcinaceae archaeon]NKQ38284.1 cobalt ECF transporter T component CbiQ [Methanosarcinales archaeon]
MNIIEIHAHNNGLSNVSGKLKIFFGITSLFVAIISIAPIVHFLIFSIMAVATVIFAKTPLSIYIKFLIAPFFLGFFAFFSLLFFYGTDYWFNISLFNLIELEATHAGFNRGLLIIGRMFSSISCLLFIAFTTPMIIIFSMINKKLPDTFVEMSMLIYRYIFILIEETAAIKHTQTIRLGYSGFKRKIHSIGMLGGNVFIRTLNHADKLMVAMDSRCYIGHLNILDTEKPLHKTHLLEMIAIIIFQSILIAINFIV